MGAWVIVFFLLLFPAIYVLLLVTDLLAFVYSPILRISIITLISAMYLQYSFRKKYTKRKNDFLENMSLQSGKIDGTDYFYTSSHNDKAKLTTISTYIEGIYGFDFTLQFEGRFERFFKSLGLNTECQSGETRFDGTAYIVSDDQWLCTQLQTNHELRTLFYDIFWCYHDQNFKIIKIQCFDGRIVVTAKHHSETNEEALIHSFASKIASLLKQAIISIPSKESINDRMYREPSGSTAHIFRVVIFALMINGIVVLLTEMTTVKILPHLVKSYSIIPLSIQMTIVMVVAFLVIAFTALRNSSRFVPVALQILTLGSFGIFTSALVEVKEINTHFDTSIPQTYDSKIVSKEAIHHRKRGTTYILNLQPWNTLHETFELKVPYSIYSQANEGDDARIIQRDGFLGYPWIDKIKITPHPIEKIESFPSR